MKNDFLRSTRFKWLLGTALVCGPFFWVPQWNNWQLSRLQNALATMKHPTDSRFVARHGEIDNFGNGNHLDFWALELRQILPQRVAKTFQTATRLQMAYQAQRLPVPNANDDDYQGVKNGTQEVAWELLPSPLPKNYQLKLGRKAWNLASFAGANDLYTVQIFNGGENDNFGVFFDARGW